MVVGCPSRAARKEHLSTFEIDRNSLINDLTAIIENPHGPIENIDSNGVGLIVFNGRCFEPDHVIAWISIFGQRNMASGGGISMKLVCAVIGIVPCIDLNG